MFVGGVEDGGGGGGVCSGWFLPLVSLLIGLAIGSGGVANLPKNYIIINL